MGFVKGVGEIFCGLFVTILFLRFWMLWVLRLFLAVLLLVTCFFCVFFDALRAPPTQERFTSVTVFFLRFSILCVLGIRSTVLPPCERQPLWEGRERI